VSAISEAKEQLALASVSTSEAKAAIEKAIASCAESIKRLDSAAHGTGHVKFTVAMKAYSGAADKLTEVDGLIVTAQEAVDEYATGLG
jgi:hypothetical protein